MRMRRRDLLAGAPFVVAGLTAPAQGQTSDTLIFVPVADVTVLDPYFAGPDVTIQHGYMVFDSLYGMDADFNPQPQMVAGHTIDDDGKRWRLTLRDGLRFHDGEPVRADDVVACIRKWFTIDVFAAKLARVTDAVTALSDQVIEFRLKRPFPLLTAALAKPATYPLFIMPKRLVALAGTGKLTEMVGSGPYRYLASERVVGSRAVYERNDAYQPRPEPGSWNAGGKIAHFKRVIWQVIPDAATAAASLQKGEVDWWGDVPPDLAPSLRRDRNLTVQVNDIIGGEAIMRFNALYPPFDNPAIRRAVLPAINQAEFMTAASGEDRTLWRDHVGVWSVGKPMSTDAGVDVMAGDIPKARRLLKDAGYQGETVVMLAAADYPSLFACAQVGADLLRQIGFKVDLQTMDFGTQTVRRGNKAPPAQGGWNVFINLFNGFNRFDPAAHLGITSSWAGWPKIDEIEAMREKWFDAPDLAARQAIARDIQLLVWRDVPYIPLGSFFPLTAFKRSISGVPHQGASFVNVRRG